MFCGSSEGDDGRMTVKINKNKIKTKTRKEKKIMVNEWKPKRVGGNLFRSDAAEDNVRGIKDWF